MKRNILTVDPDLKMVGWIVDVDDTRVKFLSESVNRTGLE